MLEYTDVYLSAIAARIMPDDSISLFGTEYHLAHKDPDTIDISCRVAVDQARRAQRYAPEATSLQEAYRMLTEEGIRRREGQITPDQIETAIKNSLSGVEGLLTSGEVAVQLDTQ